MEPRIVFNEQPPTQSRAKFKDPYTLYSRPDFVPQYIYEIVWYEKVFGGKRAVISKFIYKTKEECETAFKKHCKDWFGEIKYEIDTELEQAAQKIREEARQSRENYRRAEEILEDYYPLGLREYMERLRRKKWVKDKRKREKTKIISMNLMRAEKYIQQQMKKLDEEENV